MPKSDIKSLLLNSDQLSLSSSIHNPTLPTLSIALNLYKESLDKVHEAKSRYKVLNRHLQKQKSTTINTKKHNQYAQYIKKKADVDKYIKKWNEANNQKRLDQQSLMNKQSRKRIKDNIKNNRSFFHESNTEKYEMLKEERMENDAYMNDYNKQMMSHLIKKRESLRKKQKNRLNQVHNYHQHKQNQIKSEKQQQIRKFFYHSLNNKKIVDDIIERNYSLKNKRYKEFEVAKKLNINELPMNLASTIKNPQTRLQ